MMANKCDCCEKGFSVKNPRKHVKNYEICAACASHLNAGDIENSIKAIQEAAILAEREKMKKKQQKPRKRNLRKP